jgi:hypothetical protein
MSDQELAQHKAAIDKLTQMEMARLWRFTPSEANHPYFTNKALFEHFQARFKGMGGFTPAISKAIGW